MTDIDFTRVYMDTYKDLCLLALRYVHSVSVAEDIVQDSFCKVLIRRPEVFRFEDSSRIRAYMWRTVRNNAVDWCRKNSGKSASLEERALDAEISVMLDDLFTPENSGAFDYDVLTRTLDEVISGLPPRAHEVFMLRRDKGLSNNEVASKLGVSVKSVEKQMTISLKRIKRAFLEKGIPFVYLLFLFLA